MLARCTNPLRIVHSPGSDAGPMYQPSSIIHNMQRWKRRKRGRPPSTQCSDVGLTYNPRAVLSPSERKAVVGAGHRTQPNVDDEKELRPLTMVQKVCALVNGHMQ
eukprot:364761-Chlamydomonas_euryale.AAC.5